MRFDRMIQAVDAHAAGEHGRVIVGGVLDVPGATMYDKMAWLRANGDDLRLWMLREPRGFPAANCNLLLPPTDPAADAGYVIMEQVEYPGMSGTNTICVVTVLLETGMLPMHEPVTELTLESPAGLIRVSAACADGQVTGVTLRNVPAFATHLDTAIEVPELGTLTVDVAYDVDRSDRPLAVRDGHVRPDGGAPREGPAGNRGGVPPRGDPRDRVHGAARRGDAGRRAAGGRADHHRHRLDHRLRLVRRRPNRSVPGRVHGR
jgi:hypothetical protein